MNQDKTNQYVEAYLASLDKWLEECNSFGCELERWETDGGNPIYAETF